VLQAAPAASPTPGATKVSDAKQPPAQPQLPAGTGWCKKCPDDAEVWRRYPDLKACICDAKGSAVGFLSADVALMKVGKQWRGQFSADKLRSKMKGRLCPCTNPDKDPRLRDALCTCSTMGRVSRKCIRAHNQRIGNSKKNNKASQLVNGNCRQARLNQILDSGSTGLGRKNTHHQFSGMRRGQAVGAAVAG